MITFRTFEFLRQKSWWNLHLDLSHLGNKHTSFCSFLLNETFWGNFETLCLLTPKMQKYDLNSVLIIWFNFIAFQIKVWHKNILPHNIVIVGTKSSIACFIFSSEYIDKKVNFSSMWSDFQWTFCYLVTLFLLPLCRSIELKIWPWNRCFYSLDAPQLL